MRVAILSALYPPEHAPGAYLYAELAEGLAARGHQVTVITQFPHWPHGRVFAGYVDAAARARRAPGRLGLEDVRGVRVARLASYVPRTSGFVDRVRNFLSYSRLALRAGRRLGPFDAIYVGTPPPSLAVTAIRLARAFRCPAIVNVQDIHPDAAIELGWVRNPLLIALLRRQERWILRRATHFTPLGPAFVARLASKGVARERMTPFPNWIDDAAITPGPRENPLRAEWGISTNEVVALYAGTLGRSHACEQLVHAAVEHRRRAAPAVRWLVVGQGFGRAGVEAGVEAHALGDRFEVRDPVARERLGELQALGDIGIVTLATGRGQTSVPSKLLGHMAAGRPVVASVDADGDTARIVEAAGCGRVVAPEDPSALATAVAELAADAGARARYGRAGRWYLEKHFGRGQAVDRCEAILEAVAAGRTPLVSDPFAASSSGGDEGEQG